MDNYLLYNEAEFLDKIQTEFLRVFLLAIHFYSFALRYLGIYFFTLTQPLAVFTVC